MRPGHSVMNNNVTNMREYIMYRDTRYHHRTIGRLSLSHFLCCPYRCDVQDNDSNNCVVWLITTTVFSIGVSGTQRLDTPIHTSPLQTHEGVVYSLYPWNGTHAMFSLDYRRTASIFCIHHAAVPHRLIISSGVAISRFRYVTWVPD